MRCLAALLCLAVAGCGPAQVGSVRVDPALATLVPGDAIMLAGVRLDALRKTPVYQKYIGERNMPGLDDLTRNTGLDPRKDIWELLVVSNGVDLAVLARGNFAPQGEEPRINRPGVQRMPYKGYTLIGNEQGAVAFMNASVAVAGRPAAGRSIIDNRGKSNGIPPALRPKVDAIPSAAQLWLVAAGGFSTVAKLGPQ